MIVIGHLTFYLAMPHLMAFSISTADNFLFLFGLALFFFVSGFVLEYNYSSIIETKDMVTFLKKRLVRIYPLYWLSFIAFFFWYRLRSLNTWLIYLPAAC